MATIGITEVWRDSEIVHMPVYKNTAGDVLKNSAKSPVVETVIEPVSIGLIHGLVYKNFSDSDFKTQLNAVNDGIWRGMAAGTCWVSRITTKDYKVNGTAMQQVHYIVRYCEYGWKAVRYDIGYLYNDAGDERCFLDADGYPYVGKLDGAGGKLSISSNPLLIEEDIKREISFSVLGY